MADTTFVDGATPVVAAWLNDVNDEVYSRASVKRFGAVGDGVTDDTAAFNAALAACGIAYAPSGTYKVELSLASSNQIVGAGVNNTKLTPTGNNKTVITIDATSVAKQFCALRNLSITNPNSYTTCNGIWFKGTNVFTINDDHTLENLYIDGFDVGTKATGRLIDSVWTCCQTWNCRVGFLANTDPSSVAFIFNTFINSVWNNCYQEGMRIETVNLCNKFQTCNWQGNNRNKVGGVAGFYFQDARSLNIDSAYFENNGFTMPVDSAVPLNNAIDLRIGGTSISQRIAVDNSFFSGTGCCIYIDATVVYSCSITSTSLNPGANDIPDPNAWSFVSTTPQSGYQGFFTINPGTMCNGKVQVVGTDNLYPVSAVQNPGQAYASINGTQPTIDLLNYANWSLNTNVSNVTISTVSNRIPGTRMQIWNSAGTGVITIAAALMANGQACTIPPGGRASFTVATYPQAGKFVEESGFVGAASTTYDPPSLADGAGATTTVSVPGAALGDFAQASFSLTTSGITITAWVSATDTVSVRFQNESGGVLDIASGILKVKVTK